MSDYGWVENVATTRLSNRALMLVSRFARLIKQVNGRVINLQDPLLAKRIVREGQSSDDARVRKLFKEIIHEFRDVTENRDQPRYRGTMSADIDTEADVPKSTTAKVTYYRGVAVEREEPAKPNEQNASVDVQKFYRGVEVLVDD